MISDEARLEAQHKLAAGRILASRKMPYFTTALMAISPFEREGLGTFAVDKRWRMYYDPQKCIEYTVPEICAVWLHEVGHLIRSHSKRFAELEGFNHDPRLFNCAGDAAINSDLRDSDIILPNPERRYYAESNPEFPQWEKGMTAEEMYFIGWRKQGNVPPDESPSGTSENADDKEDGDNDSENETGKSDEAPEETDDSENNDTETEDTQADDSNEDDSEDSSEQTGDIQDADDADASDDETDESESDADDSDAKGESESDSVDEDSGEATDADDDADNDADGPADSGQESDESSQDESDGESDGDSDGDSDGESSENDADNENDASSSDEAGDTIDSSESTSSADPVSTGEPNDSEKMPDCGSAVDGEPRDYEEKDTDDGSVDESTEEFLKKKTAESIMDFEKSNPGSVPGGLLREAKDILDPQVDWASEFAALIRHVSALHAGYADYSYQRPSRRSSGSAFIMPTMRQPPAPEITIILDTSGSMDESKELAMALGEMEEIVSRSARFSVSQSVRIINCDAADNVAVIVRDLKDFEIIGGGGTDMRVGLKAAAEMKPAADIIITITDGFTPWPKEVPYQNMKATYIALIVSRGKRKPKPPPEWMKVIEVVIPAKRSWSGPKNM